MDAPDLAVVCYCWNEGYRTYTAQHVNILARMIKRNLPLDHRFICITDDLGKFSDDVTVVPTPAAARAVGAMRSPEGPQFPASYRRLWTFSKEAEALAKRVLMLDIDCVVMRSIAHLFDQDHDFVGWRPGSKWGSYLRLGGGTWLLKTGSMTHIWETFGPQGVKEARRAGFRGSDQAWLSFKLAGKVPIFPRNSGIYQAQDMKRTGYKELPSDACIVHFNGHKKPWHMNHIDWIKQYWQ